MWIQFIWSIALVEETCTMFHISPHCNALSYRCLQDPIVDGLVHLQAKQHIGASEAKQYQYQLCPRGVKDLDQEQGRY